jgi:hypothetical protein
MMAYPHNLRAPTSPSAPEAVGVCVRCYFLYPLKELRWQYQWVGNKLQNIRLRVCPRDYDTPNEQLRPIIIQGPEGVVRDPRPYQHRADAQGGPYGPVEPSGPGTPEPFIDEHDILG